MYLVFICVNQILRNKVTEYFKNMETFEISSDQDLLRFPQKVPGRSDLIVIYEPIGEYIHALEFIKNKYNRGYYIALAKENPGKELAFLINEGLIDHMHLPSSGNEELWGSIAEGIYSFRKNGNLVKKETSAEDSIEESMVTTFYIYDLIYGDMDKAGRLESLRDQFGLIKLPNCAMTIMVDNFWELCRDLDNKSRYQIKMEYLSYLREYTKISAIESIACSLIGTDKLIALLNVPAKPGQEGTELLLNLASDLKKYINKKVPNTVSIGIGNVYQDSKNVWRSYEESFKALEYSFYLGSDSVIHFEETKNYTTLENDQDKLPSFKYNFFKNINSWSETEIASYYETTIEHLIGKSFSSETIKSIVIKYNFEILDYLEQLDLDVKELSDYVIKVSSKILRAATMESIQEINREYISKIAGAIIQNRAYDGITASVESAKAFIDKYYYRELSLEVMSQVSNLSTAYFSRKFKEKTGLNFSEYLERARLENALELIKTSDISINQIAEKVGFSDSSYFSSRFKKKYGHAPYFYKQQKKEDHEE